MRVTVKFSASLLAGIVLILAVDALLTWHREVEFFQDDMRDDHELVGDLLASIVARTWERDGRDAALQVPHSIDDRGRHLSLQWVEDAAAIPAALRPRIEHGDITSIRDDSFQHTYVPVRVPGHPELVLEVRESLRQEKSFSTRSLLGAGSVAVAVLGVAAAMTVVFGFVWVGRPMQALCRQVERIGSGDLDARADVSGSDEFGQLGRAMNDMAVSLGTARERVQRETEQRLAALEQLRHADRLATVGQLAAGIAHELGTPLNVVWSLAGMIEKGEIASGEIAESAHSIAEQAQHMTAIIRQLLDFARPRAPEKVALDLVDVATRALQLLEVVAHKRGVRLQLESGGPTPVLADLSQLHQVFANLVVNAIHASKPRGVVTVRVGPATAPPPDGNPQVRAWQRVDVVDSGDGIPAEAMERLFVPFFTTKGVGEGTGLGLSVSLGIVTEHGGRITVANKPGEGACFSVFLPSQEIVG